MDQKTLDRIELLHPAIRAEVKSMYVNEICPSLKGNAICRFAYTLRSFKEQDDLFALGRTVLKDSQGKKQSIVTNAKGGQSIHNYGLAFDIVLIIDGKKASWDTVKDFDGDAIADWMEIVKIAKAHGFEWGGDWKGTLCDKPHFQKPYKYTWKQLLEKHNAGDFIPGTTYVNL
jgi:peptidoglycan L-alanyl-D-glutamate endopeptidase CwlK